MKVICGDRRTGKTTELLKLADNRNGHIVSASRRMAKITYERAKREGYDINPPLTPWDVFGDDEGWTNGMEIDKIYIDDLDRIIQYMSRYKIGAVTINRYEEGTDEN